MSKGLRQKNRVDYKQLHSAGLLADNMAENAEAVFPPNYGVEEDVLSDGEHEDFHDSLAFTSGDESEEVLLAKQMKALELEEQKLKIEIQKRKIAEMRSQLSKSAPVTIKSLPKSQQQSDEVLFNMLKNDDYGSDEMSRTFTQSGKVKYLKIKDFARSVDDAQYDDEDDEMTLQANDGSSLVIKGRKSTRKSKITVAMWISANIRIMNELKKDPSFSEEKYLEYTCQIGDLLQVYKPADKVIAYDDLYRRNIASGNIRQWGDPFQHGVTICLLKRGEDIKREVRICRDYNFPRGCSRVQCDFRHVCNVEGCGKYHPHYLHPSPTTLKKNDKKE